MADPCALVIFGAKGDLTKRKLVPALINLARQQLLPEGFAVIGFGRGDMTAESFRKRLRDEMEEYTGGNLEAELWQWMEKRIHWVSGSFDEKEAYTALRTVLVHVDEKHGTGGNAIFYLATAPSYFAPVVEGLHGANLIAQDNGWRRVVVEKPFGRDLDSARALNERLRCFLDEKQIYRIDHYLGKETVQNILVFRFANGMFEPIWNRRYVDHVQITVVETLGVEKRGGYYETSGALRDMVPNHIFQLISLVAMEPPISFDADAVRDEQSKVIRAIRPMSPTEVLSRTVRGQYGAGVAGGVTLPDYRAEERVSSNSTTETYVAMKLEIDNWRWKDVPFYLRVGKALPKRRTEIVVKFRRPPLSLFRETEVDTLNRNLLVLGIQPDEGIQLSFGAKVPGATMRIGTVNMSFTYSEHFEVAPATGYERLLYEAMLGDQTLFQRADMVEAGWRVVSPVLEQWQAEPPHSFPNYAAGSWGPKQADELLAQDGQYWHEPDK